MDLQKFSLPETDTRLITLDDTIHKIKLILAEQPIRDGTRSNPPKSFFTSEVHRDIEEIIVALLVCGDELQPIKTDRITVYPYRKKWPLADKLKFYRNEKLLKVSPFVYNFYIEITQLWLKEHEALTHAQTIQSQPQRPRKTYTNQDNDCHSCLVDLVKSSDGESDDQNRLTELEVPAHYPCHGDQMMSNDNEAETSKQTRTCSLPTNTHNMKSFPKITDGQDKVDTLQQKDVEKELSRMPTDLEKSDRSTIYEENPQSQIMASAEETESDKSDDESNKSISLLDGLQACDMVEESQETKAAVIVNHSRKRWSQFEDEYEPKKRKFSVTEYVDANRHEVQEQDLQEQLRFQELATPANEKEALGEHQTSFQRVMSSVKRLMFGSS